jgi:ribonuclease E
MPSKAASCFTHIATARPDPCATRVLLSGWFAGKDNMAKKMLIDATHPEETRVVVVDGTKVEEFDFESLNKRQLAGNIYLAKVTRVEPSLQAAFIDYGGNRHGFLAFSEIHPDYYQIPVADETVADDDTEEDIRPVRKPRPRKLQDPGGHQGPPDHAGAGRQGRTRQQGRGADHLSQPRGPLLRADAQHRARRRDQPQDHQRRRPQEAQGNRDNELDVPQGAGLIVRTAGAKRTKAEIKRDYEYLQRQWEQIRELTLKSIAPALIYQEGDLIKRSIRDLYNREIDEVLVEGEAATAGQGLHEDDHAVPRQEREALHRPDAALRRTRSKAIWPTCSTRSCS